MLSKKAVVSAGWAILPGLPALPRSEFEIFDAAGGSEARPLKLLGKRR